MTLALLAAAEDHKLQLLILQLAGFAIVIMILKRYVWGHLTSFLRKRSEGIRDTFEMIDRDGKIAKERSEEIREKLAGVGREAEERLKRALAEGVAAKKGLLAEAKKGARMAVEKVQREIGHEGDKARVELRHEVVHRVLGAAEAAIRRSMTPKLQGKLVDQYLQAFEHVEHSS